MSLNRASPTSPCFRSFAVEDEKCASRRYCEEMGLLECGVFMKEERGESEWIPVMPKQTHATTRETLYKEMEAALFSNCVRYGTMTIVLRILLNLLETSFSVPDIHVYLLRVRFLGVVVEL